MTTTYRVCENGVYRDMTQEEMQEMERAQKEWEEFQKTLPPTQEERIAELEKQNEQLKATILKLGGK